MSSIVLIALIAWAEPVPAANESPTVIVAVGAEGTAEYGRQFAEWAARWRHAAETGGARCLTVGLETPSQVPDRDRLRELLEQEAAVPLAVPVPPEPLWLVLIGHGTFDGREAKFNLRGPDVSARELDAWLEPASARPDIVLASGSPGTKPASVRPVAVINCTSASGPFLSILSAPGRVVVTATKSGHEQNFARFGDYLSRSIADADADLDKDGQTSLLEAFLTASRQTQQFYELDGRLATEHALLDDNGDGQGVRAEWFRGLRMTKQPPGGQTLDGHRAHQFHLVRSPDERRLTPDERRRRDELELDIARLREQKSQLPESEYYSQLEGLCLQLAKLYEQLDRTDEQ